MDDNDAGRRMVDAASSSSSTSHLLLGNPFVLAPASRSPSPHHDTHQLNLKRHFATFYEPETLTSHRRGVLGLFPKLLSARGRGKGLWNESQSPWATTCNEHDYDGNGDVGEGGADGIQGLPRDMEEWEEWEERKRSKRVRRSECDAISVDLHESGGVSASESSGERREGMSNGAATSEKGSHPDSHLQHSSSSASEHQSNVRNQPSASSNIVNTIVNVSGLSKQVRLSTSFSSVKSSPSFSKPASSSKPQQSQSKDSIGSTASETVHRANAGKSLMAAVAAAIFRSASTDDARSLTTSNRSRDGRSMSMPEVGIRQNDRVSMGSGAIGLEDGKQGEEDEDDGDALNQSNEKNARILFDTGCAQVRLIQQELAVSQPSIIPPLACDKSLHIALTPNATIIKLLTEVSKPTAPTHSDEEKNLPNRIDSYLGLLSPSSLLDIAPSPGKVEDCGLVSLAMMGRSLTEESAVELGEISEFLNEDVLADCD